MKIPPKEMPDDWNQLPFMTKAKSDFIQKYDQVSDRDLLVEIIHTLKNQNQILERNRSNTSKLVWWLIAIPFIIAFFFFFFSLLGLGRILSV
jgi:hypothetical protein